MTISWPLSRQQVLDANGHPLLVPSVNFYVSSTSTPLVVYADSGMTQPRTQPVVADAFGRFPRVYLPVGLYREQVLDPNGGLLWDDDGLGEAVVADTTDPVTPVDPSGVAATGDVKWRLDGSIQPGWVRMNARTIGGAGSGATELADASARALFISLWSSFPDIIASVVGGRGTSATDDFSAGKQITIPTMQGFVAGGLDDMGSTAVNRLQWTTNLALTAGSTAAQVADPSRIVLGMFVSATGISAGTQVVGINGGNITLSQPAAAGSTGTVLGRFSSFGDAQVPGSTGGDSVEGLGNLNLPSNLPSGAVTVTHPGQTYVSRATPASASTGAGGSTISDLWQGTVNATTTPQADENLTVTNANPGGGVPISTLQPTRLGTFYLKL